MGCTNFGPKLPNQMSKKFESLLHLTSKIQVKVQPHWVKPIMGQNSQIKWWSLKFESLFPLTSKIQDKTLRGQITLIFQHQGFNFIGSNSFWAKTPKSNDGVKSSSNFCLWPQKFKLRPLDIKGQITQIFQHQGFNLIGLNPFGPKLPVQMMESKVRVTFAFDLENSR